MKTVRLLALVAAISFAATKADAHHAIWFDFSAFDLSAWREVNGNKPPIKKDLAATTGLITANLAKDFAPFDVYFTFIRPADSPFTRVVFYLGTARDLGRPTDSLGTAFGTGAWENSGSRVEVYAGAFARYPEFITVSHLQPWWNGTPSLRMGTSSRPHIRGPMTREALTTFSSPATSRAMVGRTSFMAASWTLRG